MPQEVKIEEEIKKPADTPSDVQVEFDDNNQPIKKEEAKKETPQTLSAENFQKYQTEIDKKLNASFYGQRKIEEQLKEIAQRLQPPPAKEVATPSDEWDQKVQKDWKGTVQELAEKRFQELKVKEIEQSKITAREQQENQIREDSKRKVLEKYPDLNDESSERAQLYRQIVMANQDYLYNPRGPVLAMRDMEEKLREEGKLVDDPTKRMVEKEVQRQARANGGQPPAGVRGKSNVIVLSKEEKEFCDNHGLKYESYAKSKRMTSTSQGVEV